MPGDTFQEGPIPSGNQHIDLLYGAVDQLVQFLMLEGIFEQMVIA